MAQLDKIRLSGTTYDIIDATAIHSLDGYWTTGETTAAITAATNALAESIAEQNYATTGYVQEAIAEASGVTTGQVQTMIDDSISGKADTTAVTQAISEATSGKVDNDTYTAYTAATDTALGNKADKSNTIVNWVPDAYSSGQTSGDNGQLNVRLVKGNNTTGSVYTVISAKGGLFIERNIYGGADIKVDFNTVAAKTDIPSVSGYADTVAYDTNSKYMKFYHGGTGGTEVYSFDASPFLIDGMVQNVEIKDVEISGETVTCLVVSFNTDAGKQDINIPLTDIFDASNYYTKTEVDAALSAKSDSSAVTEEISAAVSGKVDNSTYTAYTASTDTVLGGKADTTAVTQAISEAVSGKADTTAVTQSITEATSGKADTSTVEGINNTLTAHTANTDIHVTTSDKSTWSGKQDALVSGTNIKTINGNSLLGSGDLTVDTGLHAEVSGTTLVFS